MSALPTVEEIEQQERDVLAALPSDPAQGVTVDDLMLSLALDEVSVNWNLYSLIWHAGLVKFAGHQRVTYYKLPNATLDVA